MKKQTIPIGGRFTRLAGETVRGSFITQFEFEIDAKEVSRFHRQHYTNIPHTFSTLDDRGCDVSLIGKPAKIMFDGDGKGDAYVGLEESNSEQHIMLKVAYVGAKIVLAQPMSFLSFKEFKKERTDQVEDMPGYKVTYEDGYENWCPKDTFECCYRPITQQEANMVKDTQVKA